MTMHFNPAAQPGYRPMPGGYEQAVQQAQQAAGQGQFQQPVQGQAGYGPPQMQAALPQDSVSPLQQMQQIQQQLPVNQQQQQQPVNQFQPPNAQGGQRFGDPRQQQQQVPPQQQAAANIFGQQLAQQGFQQPFQAPAGLDVNTVLQGPNVPAELQGRTLGQAISIYNGLRQTHMQLMAGQQPQFQQPVQQQQHPQQQAGQQGQQQGFDWRNPASSIAAVVAPMLDERMSRLEGALAPVVQAGNMTAINQARAQAAAQIGPLFTQLEPQILQSLQGADPRALAHPGLWLKAAHAAIGEAQIRGNQQAQQLNGGIQAPGLFPPQAVPQGAQPLPNLNSFFTEQAYQGGQGAQGAMQLTPAQRGAAAAMGISDADYAAYYVMMQQPRQQGRMF